MTEPYINFAVLWRTTPVGGASDTRVVHLKAFAKLNTATTPFVVANEYVASRLGLRLGLPLPPGTLIEPEQASGPPAWVTVAFSKDEPPPVDPVEVVQRAPDLAAGVAVFDLLIGNFDRHAGNLRLSGQRLDVFDHSHALFGVDGDPVANLQTLREQFALDGPTLWGVQWNRHCLIDHLTDVGSMQDWVSDVKDQLKDRFLRQVADEVAAIRVGINSAAADALVEFLSYRRDNLNEMLKNNQQEFPQIAQWGLGI